ncbi:zinc finger CCCH domain-containing protein 4 [Ischnura elegans]|uniref:zinc finger CCCH domain-containing protein 4 n=1 Tax=Ischnura elegans TaxID=197161 RepID=UPI001ED877A7|nr:zinc finger CCCH domain-containing protein 4 [Ischnura elegans]
MAAPRAAEPDSTPTCRCRVLYLGSAVPHVTKDGLQGIQEPLRELYPEQGASGAKGIDSWLSVWSNGLLLENVDENLKEVTRFFPIESLHYCAAVRYVAVVPGSGGSSNGGNARFLPLHSPFARGPSARHPPLFAAILRRTTGIKVLECHAFICKKELAAISLVQCFLHAYADSSYARNSESGGGGNSVYGTLRTMASNTMRRDGSSTAKSNGKKKGGSVIADPVTSLEKVEGWETTPTTNGHGPPPPSQNGTLRSSAADEMSVYNGDENHKVWAGVEPDYGDYSGSTLRSVRSSNTTTPGGTNRRPRQVSKATPPPPPPPAPSDADERKKAKEKKNNAKKNNANKEMMMMMHYNGGAPTLMRNGRPGSAMSGGMANGGMMRAPSMPALHLGNGYPHPHQMAPPPHMVLVHPPAMHPHGKRMMQHPHTGTFTHRPKAGGMMIPRGMPPPIILAPAPMATMPHNKKGKGMPHPVIQYPPTMHPAMMPPPAMMPQMVPPQFMHGEEPVYMPSGRPLSPPGPYQPGPYPPEAYLMQQYATTERPGRRRRTETPKDPRRIRREQDEEEDGRDEEEVAVELSAEGEDLPIDSPFNTGIYRKKGHLNERAFSYSIRQEHRARSYGSLANLKFATNGGNGVGPSGPPREDIKKEREIMQMMQDLDLSGDDLERSEVPPEVYENRRRRADSAVVASGRR